MTVPACVKPGAPRSLRITENGPSSIELTWTAPSNAATVGVHEYVLEQLRDGFTDWDTEAEHISTRPADSDSFRFTASSMRAGDTRQYRLSAMRYVRFPTNIYPGYAYPEDPIDHTLRIRSNPSNTVSFTHLTGPASPWLTAETDGDGVALLTWSAPTDDGGTRVTSYQLQRSKVAGETMPDPEDASGWTNLGVPSSGQYRHTGLTAGDTWHYRMRARNSEDWSSWFYAQVTIPEGGLPNAPRLTTRFSGTAVDLSWTEPTGIGLDTENSDGTTTNTRADCNGGSSWTASDRGNFVCYYELRMEEDGGGWPTSSTTTALCATPDGLRTCEVARDQRNSHRPTLLRITIDETSHSYERLLPGASYKFRVRAVTALVDEHESRFGAWSNIGTVRVPGGPTRESDVTGEVIPVTPNEPTISFTEKANNAGSDATIRWSLPIDYTGSVSYRLQWENPTTGQWQTLTNTSATSYTHRNLHPSTRYSYRVAVRYGSGVGPYSRSASGITPGVAFPPDAPKGVRVTSINTTGFNVAWDRSPSASTYTPATNRYVYGLCKWGTEKRTIIDGDGNEITGDAPVLRCDASQSTTGTTARITAEPGERIFGVAAVNRRGQSDWTTVYVSVPTPTVTTTVMKSLRVTPTSLTLTEGDYDRGGSYTVRLVNAAGTDSVRLSIDSGYDRNALITWECDPKDCMLTSDNSHTVTVKVIAMWDGDREDGVLTFHNEILDLVLDPGTPGDPNDPPVAEVRGSLSGASVRVTVRDKVNEPPKINNKGNGGEIAATIAENSTGSLGTYTFTDKENDIWRLGILPESELYQSLSFQGDHLMLGSKLDFEKPSDKNRDGIYEIKLYARDRFSTTIVTVKVRVTNVIDSGNRAPSISPSGPLTGNYAENGTAPVSTLTATDPDGGVLTWSISGGADQNRFNISKLADGRGQLSFKSPPDFETPRDTDGDNVYVVEIKVTDADGLDSAAVIVNVTVTDVAE